MDPVGTIGKFIPHLVNGLFQYKESQQVVGQGRILRP
jgi:hypothetical protein